jgi:hypothetical protein
MPPKKKNPSTADPSLDFKSLLARVQSAGSAAAVKGELESFQSRMKAKTTPGQTANAYAIRDRMLAERQAQGKKGVPMTEVERQAFMKDILTGMGVPPSAIQKKKGKQ